MLLNSSRKIFIGSVSTLLFEANVSGHLTARVDFEPNLISDLDTDLICSQDDLSTLAGWVLDQIQNPTPKPAMSDDDVNKLSSEDRFLKALSEIS